MWGTCFILLKFNVILNVTNPTIPSLSRNLLEEELFFISTQTPLTISVLRTAASTPKAKASTPQACSLLLPPA